MTTTTNPRNRRTPENARETWRWKTGGKVYAARTDPELRQAIARAGGNAAMSAYGDSPAARSLRASDLRRKQRLSPQEWRMLLASRERSFGLPEGSLK